MVTFARERMDEWECRRGEAAVAAGHTRMRPVLMTPLADDHRVMAPMAMGFGEGGEAERAAAACR